MDDREFNSADELERLTDSELEAIVIQGANLHIHTSKASMAKRILENRRQSKLLKSTENVESVAKQLKESNKGLSEVISGLGQIIKYWKFSKPIGFRDNLFG